ncbi:MAG TPA: hypothetical protein VJ729_17320 [Nitrososphaeraceae archaeon]|nr:hypothetical protein [Nitrososphaeraceae archaeon]
MGSIRGLGIEMKNKLLLLKLYNYFRESNAGQDQIEAFGEKVHSGYPKTKLLNRWTSYMTSKA